MLSFRVFPKGVSGHLGHSVNPSRSRTNTLHRLYKICGVTMGRGPRCTCLTADPSPHAGGRAP